MGLFRRAWMEKHARLPRSLDYAREDALRPTTRDELRSKKRFYTQVCITT
jgi:hypothetical protein